MNSICSNCILQKNLVRYPAQADPEVVSQYQEQVKSLIENSSPEAVSVEVNDEIKKLRYRLFGEKERDYTEIKRHFNELMLSFEATLEEKVNEAADPFLMAARYAMTGNFIDFAALADVDEKKLAEFIDGADQAELSAEAIQQLREETLRASSLVYLTDNCGEIVMDKLLIRQLLAINPRLSVTVIVRGEPTVNDATIEDARQVGLTCLARVIGNGTDLNGTVLRRISREARQCLDNADVIIAKGQGNYETMTGCGLPVFYLFMCKCEFFTDRFGVKLYDGVLTREQQTV